ncbi:hypothetical protein M407DRAFT_22010 [Tulasnella calospora MUT 4182]|uniref:F-box domain-containing protein n=1 Tax=Tulasnella calospora MUT 4182 TaxID=1051891 RepID=A0A0C3L5A3_9AGAM|nr:hypothetical protein M407DRAFT_22010 [Tulasnella calospora MUT 4182]
MVSWKLRKKFERHETLPEPLPETLPKTPSLPYEILLLIVQLSDKRSLVRLIRTCHRLRRFGEPILYRHIRAHQDDRGRNLHRMLVGRPDLLPVILSYHGPLIMAEANDAKAEGIISSGLSKGEALWRKMRIATRKWVMNDPDPVERAKIIFSGAVNIRVLHFTDTRTNPEYAQVFGDAGAPLGSKATNIQSLVLNVGSGSPHLALGPILRVQLRLKHLELRLKIYVPIELDKTDLPELESLKAKLRYAAKIVPGRPVKRLELLGDWRPSRNSLQQLALSTCGITELTAKIGFRRGDLRDEASVRALAQSLRGIERLCFLLIGPMMGTSLRAGLRAYRSLSHLTLVGPVYWKRNITFSDEWQPPVPYHPMLYARYVEDLKASCPALVEVCWSETATESCCGWDEEDPDVFRITQ